MGNELTEKFKKAWDYHEPLCCMKCANIDNEDPAHEVGNYCKVLSQTISVTGCCNAFEIHPAHKPVI